MGIAEITDLLSDPPSWVKWIFAHIEVIAGATAGGLAVVLAKVGGYRKRKVYEQPKADGFADFETQRSKTYVKDGPIGEPGEGEATVLKDGLIQINRTNAEGRVILKFLRFQSEAGKDLSYIPARTEAGSQRTFEIALEAQAIHAPHQLRLAFRSHPNEEFIQDAYISVEPDRWQKLGRLMIPRADRNMYFFVESSAQKQSGGAIQIRKLVLSEQMPDRFKGLINLLNRLARRENKADDS